MIAKKREVAACKWQVFRGANVKLGNWRQVTDITSPSQKTVDALSRLEMPAGVFIDIKMKNK